MLLHNAASKLKCLVFNKYIRSYLVRIIITAITQHHYSIFLKKMTLHSFFITFDNLRIGNYFIENF